MDATDNNELFMQDDIEDQRSTKRRDHNAATLKSLLHNETELAAKTKVHEDLLKYTTPIHLQEVKEMKNSLMQPVAKLNEYKEELRQHLELEMSWKHQCEKEIFDSERIKNIFHNNYSRLTTGYNMYLNCMHNYNKQYKEECANYDLQKKYILENIANQKEKINELLNYMEKEQTKYEAEIKKGNETMVQIKDSISKIEQDIADIEYQREMLKNEYEKNETTAADLNQNISSYEASIHNYTSLLEELEAKRVSDKENNDIILKKQKEEHQSYSDYLCELNQKVIAAQERLDQAKSKTKDLEDRYLKLDDIKAELELEKYNLTNSIDNITAKWNSVQEHNSLNNEHDDLKLTIDQHKLRLNEIVSLRDNKIKQVNVLQENIAEEEEKSAKLLNLMKAIPTEKLIDVDAKLEDLTRDEVNITQEIDALKSSLSNAQEKQMTEKRKYEKLNADLDYELTAVKSRLQEANNQHPITIKRYENKLNNLKYQHEVVHKQNQDDKEKKLQEMKNEVQKLKNCLKEKTGMLTVKKQEKLQKNNLPDQSLKEKTVGQFKPPRKVQFDMRTRFNSTSQLQNVEESFSDNSDLYDL